jgi:hypothetical protein
MYGDDFEKTDVLLSGFEPEADLEVSVWESVDSSSVPVHPASVEAHDFVSTSVGSYR